MNPDAVTAYATEAVWIIRILLAAVGIGGIWLGAVYWALVRTRHRNDHLDEENVELQAEVDRLREVLDGVDELKDAYRKLDRDNEMLKAEHAAQTAEMERVGAKYQAQKRDLEHAQRQRDFAIAVGNKMQSKVEGLKAAVKTKDSTLEVLWSSVKRLQQVAAG